MPFTLMTYSTMKEREINNKDLKSYVKLLKREGLSEEYHGTLNKYLQRFFHPLICILLAILGCLLGFSKPREQRLIGFTIAIGFIFVYYITLPFFDLLAGKRNFITVYYINASNYSILQLLFADSTSLRIYNMKLMKLF